jgi:16S rRNA (uracil1498-N3)-methyltransferase
MKGRFFVELDPHDGERAFLDAATARHLRALRVTRGDEVCAIVGPGRERRARVASLDRERAVLALGDVVPSRGCDPACARTLAVALADAARLDLVVEKATELGATAIQPFVAARSQARTVAPARLERWRRIARAASEQCGRTTIPEVRDAVDLSHLAAALAPGSVVWLLTPGGAGEATGGPTRAASPEPRPLVVVVGPEGGLTDEEHALLVARGAEPVRLGPRVLRFETAAIAALAVAGALLPDGAGRGR